MSKQFFINIVFLAIFQITNGQENTGTQIPKGQVNTETQKLNGVTFGFAAGYSVLNEKPLDYYLSSDTMKSLQTQNLSKSSFVISSVISIKLAKLAVNTKTNRLMKRNVDGTTESAKWYQKFSINAALNLVELSNSDIAFNKSIDGGLGLGFYLTDFVQVSAFYDIIVKRQLRDNIVSDYLGKRIPNGSDYFNALDQNDNNLFFNKTFTGWSFKVIMSLGNKND